MSIVTGTYYEIPIYENGFGHYDNSIVPEKGTKRRFFQNIGWDEIGILIDDSINTRTDILNGYTRGHSGSLDNLSGILERGGDGTVDADVGYLEDDGDEGDDYDEDVAMSIDS